MRSFLAIGLVGAFASLPTAQETELPPPELSGAVLEYSIHERHASLGNQATSEYRVFYVDGKVPVLEVVVKQWGIEPEGSVSTFEVVATASATYPLRYRPTALTRIGERRILIAGLHPDGRTLIENRSFTPPKLKDVTNPQSELQTGGLRSLTVLYDAKVDGRKNVSLMRKVWGAGSTKAIIYFWESHDVYLLDVVTENHLQLLASPQAQPIVPQPFHIPELSLGFTRMEVGVHADYGTTYELYPPIIEWANVEDDPNLVYSVVFLDSDRNGAIDSFFLGSKAEFEARSWDDEDKWQ